MKFIDDTELESTLNTEYHVKMTEWFWGME